MLNPELAEIARYTIKEMREEGWPDDDIQWSASGAILKHCESQDILDEDPSKEDMAAILALVKMVLRESQEIALPEWAQPVLRACPYCGAYHNAADVEQCPLRPNVC